MSSGERDGKVMVAGNPVISPALLAQIATEAGKHIVERKPVPPALRELLRGLPVERRVRDSFYERHQGTREKERRLRQLARKAGR
jgi:hypothetical protein